ncbi:MAG: sugar phosphate isomerase/epimerase family protein [Thermoplasmataceae archaeon]
MRSIDTLLDFVEKNHFNSIELWDSPVPDTNGRLSKYLNGGNRDLSIHAPLLNIGDVDSINFNIISLRESIQRSSQWGANRLILHAGLVKKEDKEIALESAKKVIYENLRFLEKCDLTLCIENVGYLNGDLLKNFEDLAIFVDYFPIQLVGVAFDVSHANITGDVKEGINILGNRIKELHLSDNMGNIEKHHLPLGRGDIDFKVLNNNLISKDVVAILEIEPEENWKKGLFNSRLLLQEFKIID